MLTEDEALKIKNRCLDIHISTDKRSDTGLTDDDDATAIELYFSIRFGAIIDEYTDHDKDTFDYKSHARRAAMRGGLRLL